jgi:hypothetical protein
MSSQITGPINMVAGWVELAVRLGLLVLIGAAVLAEFGVRVAMLPRPSVQALAFLCGAWWLYRGGKL